MKKTDLKIILDKEKFNSRIYSLDGDADEKLCLSDELSQWCVYHSERGGRTSERCYSSEDEACTDFLQRLRALPVAQSRM